MKLFIDDIRNPSDVGWHVARSSQEAISFMSRQGCPRVISFDHDLGGEDTAMKVVKWMIEKDLDEQGGFIPEDFAFLIHSSNPVGRRNIDALLSRYLAFRG